MTTDGESRGPSAGHCPPGPKDLKMFPSPISPVSPQSDPGRLVISSPSEVYCCSSPRSTSSPDLLERASSPDSDPGLPSDGDQVAPSLTVETTARRGYGVDQVAAMRAFFCHTPDPTHDQYQQLSAAIRLNTRRIKLWFQNQRAKDQKVTSVETSPASSRDVSLNDDTDANDSCSSLDKARDDLGRPEQLRCEDGGRPSTGEVATTNTTTTTEYKAMTTVSLPPDHPFCQLLSLQPNARRARRPQKPRPVDQTPTTTTTPVARPLHARSAARRLNKRAEKPVQALSRKQEAPPALWRPIDAGNPPTVAALPTPLPHPAPSGSPLDLSVSLKRKRASSSDAPASGEPAKRSHVDARLSQHPLAAAHPMMFPPAFPYYPGNPFMPLGLPTFPPGALQSLPLGLYPPPLNVWGMPSFGHPQKTVR